MISLEIVAVDGTSGGRRTGEHWVLPRPAVGYVSPFRLRFLRPLTVHAPPTIIKKIEGAREREREVVNSIRSPLELAAILDPIIFQGSRVSPPGCGHPFPSTPSSSFLLARTADSRFSLAISLPLFLSARWNMNPMFFIQAAAERDCVALEMVFTIVGYSAFLHLLFPPLPRGGRRVLFLLPEDLFLFLSRRFDLI